jgi:hippurate hydrolase
MTGWVGAAKRLVAMKDKWSGTLVMIAQPAEEVGAGARAMLADGLYSRFPKPSVAIAFHDSAALPAGTIGITPGYALANVDSVDITVKGIGGHGAYPHTTKDPIVIASRIVGTLQTIVSREVDPQDAAVVTVGSFHAGTKHNIISAEAKLQLTVRTYSPETRAAVLGAIKRIAVAEAMAAGMPDDKLPEVTVDKSQDITATFNTQPLTDKVTGAFQARFGEDRVRQIAPSMGGEDFSEYLLADKSMQSLIFWVGGVPKAEWDKANGDLTKLPSIHSAYWAPDPEPTISTAVEAMTLAALEVLGKK